MEIRLSVLFRQYMDNNFCSYTEMLCKPNIARNSLQSLPPFNIYWIKEYKNFAVLSFKEGAENLLKAPRKLIIVFFSADLAGEY